MMRLPLALLMALAATSAAAQTRPRISCEAEAGEYGAAMRMRMFDRGVDHDELQAARSFERYVGTGQDVAAALHMAARQAGIVEAYRVPLPEQRFRASTIAVFEANRLFNCRRQDDLARLGG